MLEGEQLATLAWAMARLEAQDEALFSVLEDRLMQRGMMANLMGREARGSLRYPSADGDAKQCDLYSMGDRYWCPSRNWKFCFQFTSHVLINLSLSLISLYSVSLEGKGRQTLLAA